jgi:ribose 5-phosphate isomerase B
MKKDAAAQKKKLRVALSGPGYSYKLRKAMAEWLTKNGYEWHDFGSFEDGSQPYVDLSLKVAEGVASGKFDTGVILCWSGIGPALIANKVPGCRAAVVTTPMLAEACRKGNGVNILTSGTLYIKSPAMAQKIIKKWVETSYCLPQWTPEMMKINKLERKYLKTDAFKNYDALVKSITHIEKPAKSK